MTNPIVYCGRRLQRRRRVNLKEYVQRVLIFTLKNFQFIIIEFLRVVKFVETGNRNSGKTKGMVFYPVGRCLLTL